MATNTGGRSEAMQKRKERLQQIESESTSESKQVQESSETNVPAPSAGTMPDESTFRQAVEAAYNRLKNERGKEEAAEHHIDWLNAAEELAHELIQQAALAQTPVPRGLQQGFQAATDDPPQGRQGHEHLGPRIPMHDRRGRRVGWARMSWVPDETPAEEASQRDDPPSYSGAQEDVRSPAPKASQEQHVTRPAAEAPPRLNEKTQLQRARAQRRIREDAAIAAALQAQEDRYGAYGGYRGPAASNGRRGGHWGQRGPFGSWW